MSNSTETQNFYTFARKQETKKNEDRPKCKTNQEENFIKAVSLTTVKRSPPTLGTKRKSCC